MTKTDTIILELSRHIEQNFLFGARKVAPEEHLLASGTIDSTGVMELLGFVEQQYGVTFKDEELVGENFETVKRMAEFVAAKLQG